MGDRDSNFSRWFVPTINHYRLKNVVLNFFPWFQLSYNGSHYAFLFDMIETFSMAWKTSLIVYDNTWAKGIESVMDIFRKVLLLFSITYYQFYTIFNEFIYYFSTIPSQYHMRENYFYIQIHYSWTNQPFSCCHLYTGSSLLFALDIRHCLSVDWLCNRI